MREREREKVKSLKFFFHLLLTVISGSESNPRAPGASRAQAVNRSGAPGEAAQPAEMMALCQEGCGMVGKGRRGWRWPPASCPAGVSQRN